MAVQGIADALSSAIIQAASQIVKNAKFDRTSIGSVTAVDGNVYTVAAFGGSYKISSSRSFVLHERVAVTAPQNDFKHLIIRKL